MHGDLTALFLPYAFQCHVAAAQDHQWLLPTLSNRDGPATGRRLPDVEMLILCDLLLSCTYLALALKAAVKILKKI